MRTEHWFLEDLDEGEERIIQIPLVRFPIDVGRGQGCGLVLRSRKVSQRHAEIFENGGTLSLREFGSTNGTFVNGRRVDAPMAVKSGDLIHFADQEFRLVRRSRMVSLPTDTAGATHADLSMGAIEKLGAFQELLTPQGLREGLRVEFQPLLRLEDESVQGYEALGRAQFFGGEVRPGELFALASKLSRESELSAALREKSLEEAQRLPPGSKIFVNTHPREFDDDDVLLASLEELSSRYPETHLVLEVHERAVADLAVWKQLGSRVRALGIDIAFDDFGIGQNRLMELTQISVSYLKFDAVWVRDLHMSSVRHREMLRTLISMAASFGIETIAEGIESSPEATACRLAGFGLGQGYFFGHPAPVASFAGSALAPGS